MDFKIINEPTFETSVLIRRNVDEDGDPVVVTETYMNTETEDGFYMEEIINFSSVEQAQSYVRDFSAKSAKLFIVRVADENGIKL